MPMPRTTIRLPKDIERAYEMADGGSKSALMRRVLTDAVADGSVEGVPHDLRRLAQRERAVDTGRLARKRGTFKQRVYGYYADKWESGAVTPIDARDMAASWRNEAALYDDDTDDGEPHEAFLDAILDWYAANWSTVPSERPPWPDAGKLLRAAGLDAEADPLGADAALVEQLEEYAAEDVEPEDAVEQLAEETGVSATDAFEAMAEADGYDQRGGDA